VVLPLAMNRESDSLAIERPDAMRVHLCCKLKLTRWYQ